MSIGPLYPNKVMPKGRGGRALSRGTHHASPKQTLLSRYTTRTSTPSQQKASPAKTESSLPQSQSLPTLRRPGRPPKKSNTTAPVRSVSAQKAEDDDDDDDEVPRSSRRVSKLSKRESLVSRKKFDSEETSVPEEKGAVRSSTEPVDEKDAEKERELYERWAEEYFEIVDQLPIELHRTFALMRELEGRVQNHVAQIGSNAKAYRDARLEQVHFSDHAGPSSAGQEQTDSQQGEENIQRPDDSLALDLDTGSEADAEGEEEDTSYLHPQDLHGDNEINAEFQRPSSEPTQTSSKEVDNALASTSHRTSTKASRLALLNAISQASADALRASDEKVGLAVAAYDWVDRHIRRLDSDLQKSENSLLLGLRAGTEASRGLQDALGVTQKPDEARTHATSQLVDPSDAASVSDGFMGDMAVDPNEPRYCYCNQVSFGDMIACDNEDCPREWFHYHCVGLHQPPKGRWFCLFCAPPGYKGSGTFPPNAPCLPPNLQGAGASASGRGRMLIRGGEERKSSKPRGRGRR